jgi:REP element-mobilizing transposase RayT
MGMANTYTALFYHFVFSTKQRIEFIKPEIEERVWIYLAGIARKRKMTPIQIGGAEDHIHALVGVPPPMAPFEVAKYLKGTSSKWIHEEFSELANFGWQDGYGAVTV